MIESDRVRDHAPPQGSQGDVPRQQSTALFEVARDLDINVDMGG
jgi:hypothetical protein